MNSLSLPLDEDEAFALVAEHTYRPMVRYAASLVGRELAEDAAQEALVKAWRYLDTFDGHGSVEGWMLRICRRAAFDLLRREGADRDRRERAVTPQSHVRPHGAVDIGVLVDELPLPEKEAFVLTQVIELGYGEAADVLDIPVGTVKSRVARARSVLSDMLRTAEAS